jgi:hypothetical protein
VVGELDVNLHRMGGVMGWGVGGVGGVEQMVTILKRCPVGWIQFVGVEGVRIGDEASLSNSVSSSIQS